MAANGKNFSHEISEETVKFLSHAIGRTAFGAISLIIQDGRLIQIDVSEKIRCQDGVPILAQKKDRILEEGLLRVLINEALSGMKFGQVSLLIQDGRVSQIERIAKQRMRPQQGMDGEGI